MAIGRRRQGARYRSIQAPFIFGVGQHVANLSSSSHGNGIEFVAVRVEEDPAKTLISQGLTNSSGVYSFSFTGTTPQTVFVLARLKGWLVPPPLSDSIVGGTGLSAAFTFSADPTVNLP